MADSKEIIQARLLSNISDEYDKTEGSFFYDVEMPVAIELVKVDVNIENATAKLDIRNLTGDELAQRVYERTGVIKKLATKATTTATVIGSVGTTTNIGDKVASDNVNFLFAETKMLDATGTTTVAVICEIAGSIGNVPAGAIKYFPVTLSGLTSVTNVSAITNGYDEESDADLLGRYFEKIQTPATSNNKAHYKSWAKEITGVGDAKVFSLWNGDNTVKVVIIDSNKQPAGNELVFEVQEYIDPDSAGLGDGVSSVGGYCTVESATGKTINISFTSEKDINVTDSVRQSNVETNIENYFKTIAYEETQISYAKVSAAILGSNGILDISNLLINSGTANIPISQALPLVEVPVLGVVTIA